MNLLHFLSLASLALCAPTRELDVHPAIAHVVRDTIDGTIMSELYNGPCRDVTFIFARGSTEVGNIGNDVGRPLSEALKAKYGDSFIATQGVGYGAHLLTNLLPKGCSPTGINNMTAEIQYATQTCPDTQIIIGGYSQGAACTHAAVDSLDAATVARITAAVLFGDTKHLQTGGKLGAMDPARVETFCASHDFVCDGTLIVDAAHVSYAANVPAAVDFLSSWIVDGDATGQGSGTAY